MHTTPPPPDVVPAGVTVAELAAALRRDAEGYLPTMAAVELLIAHRHWLSRDPFRCWCVSWLAADDEGPAVATIAWNATAALLAGQLIPGEPRDTDSERGVLAVAASIAAGHPCDLGSALLACDQTNVRRIADAVRTAGGV